MNGNELSDFREWCEKAARAEGDSPITAGLPICEPATVGASVSPMPTQEDLRAAWRSMFIQAAVDSGTLDESHAADLFEAGKDDWDYSMQPADAFAEEVSYWTDDGDHA
jgi:hypothetical protein